MRVFLFAHTDKKGKNIAQATVVARNYTQARVDFDARYPERDISTTGEKGVE